MAGAIHNASTWQWEGTFNHALVKAGAAPGSFGWWRMSFSKKDDERYFDRVWTCGALTLQDAIDHPAPAGRYLAVEAHIAWNWVASTCTTHWFAWLVEDGVLVKRPVEVATTAALNLEFLGSKDRERTLSDCLGRFKKLAHGLATRTLCWREDVQEESGLWSSFRDRVFGSPVPKRRAAGRINAAIIGLPHPRA